MIRDPFSVPILAVSYTLTDPIPACADPDPITPTGVPTVTFALTDGGIGCAPTAPTPVAPTKAIPEQVQSAMTYENLRQSPVYKRALLTPNVMRRLPADYSRRGGVWRVKPITPLIENQQVIEAGLKLDHIMRQASTEFGYVHPVYTSAIRAFLELFAETLPRMRLTVEVRRGIDVRIAFCHEIIAVAVAEGHDCSADEFKSIIIRLGGNVSDVIYNNPFYYRAEIRPKSKLESEMFFYWE